VDGLKHDRCPLDLGAEELSALLDGDLASDRAEALGAHLASCAACRRLEDELRALRGGLGALREVTPGRDLWADIRRARRRELGAERGGFWRRFWLAPAGALAGAAAAALALWLALGPGEPAARPPVEAMVAVLEAERTYQTAIAGLESALAEPGSGFDSEARRTIRQGLADIDAVIARCREALRAAPEDLGAHRAMLAAYQHKVDFLSDLVGEAL